MKTSESIGEVAKALVQAQAELKVARKDAVNPHFKSKYADLASVWEAAGEALEKHGISVIQPLSRKDDGSVGVTTVIVHSSGQWISDDTLYLPVVQPTPQAVGSAITYGRRYGLSSMLGIVADVDDDGNAASGRPVSIDTAKASLAEWIVPFGDNRGKRLSELPPAEVRKLKAYIAAQVNDPAKKQFRENNEKILAMIDAHLMLGGKP